MKCGHGVKQMRNHVGAVFFRHLGLRKIAGGVPERYTDAAVFQHRRPQDTDATRRKRETYAYDVPT